MASEEEELASISDYIVAILRSPTWVSPISKFVDDNCGMFEDVEENKLEYTLVHNAFKQLVDDLLAAHLCEMSLSTEQFVRFCERGLSGNNELHRSLVEQLISVDDFMVFKAMMVKRNCEINREVLGPPLSGAALTSSNEPGMSDAQQESAEETERLEAERRCVEAELQLAEALSLQLEKRLQLMEALDEVLELVSKIYKLRADALEQQVEEEKAKEQELLQAAASMMAPALASAPSTMMHPPAHLAPISHTPQLAPVICSTVSVRPLAEAPPLPPIPNYAGLANSLVASPEMQQKKAEAAMQKHRAEQASAVKRQDQYGSDPAATMQPSEEEKLARTEHLKRQRAALLEKKNQERENQLSSFQMAHGATNASCVAQRALQQTQLDAGQQLANQLSGLAAQPTAALPDPNAAAVEMRRMLTRQLKNSFH